MQPLTKEAIARVLGPVDDALAAQLVSTGASEEELREAFAWVSNDEPLVNDLRPFPKDRIAAVIEILEAQDQPDDA